MQMEKPNRSPEVTNKKEFIGMLELQKCQPWVINKQDELYELLEECEKPEEKDFIIGLLKSYENFDEKRVEEALKQIVFQVEDVWRLDPMKTYIVALHNDGEPGSGIAFLQNLKPHLDRNKWNKKLKNGFREVIPDLKDGMNIVIVDDFIGSGRQFCKLIEWLETKLNAAKIKLSGKYLVSLCMMQLAVPRVEKLVEAQFSTFYLNRGISDRVLSGDVGQAICQMEKLENKLEWRDDEQRKRFSLGYNQSEALFRHLGNNAPNNNFPIFWWKRRSDGTRRKTMQSRF